MEQLVIYINARGKKIKVKNILFRTDVKDCKLDV
jgi:hypothetical protein